MRGRVGWIWAFAPVAGALMLGAGSTYRIMVLVPQNDEARAISTANLSAHLEGQSGNGEIWIKLPDGEVLKGQFKVNVGGSVGAYGKSHGLDEPGGAYTGGGGPIIHGNPAIADMKGASGLTVHCEAINDAARLPTGAAFAISPTVASIGVLY